MKNFQTPTREEVSPANQALFDNLTKGIGFVPNLFAAFAKSENALANYLNLSNAKTSFRAKEKEVINLAVSQANECEYCLSAHSAIAKNQGFTDEQILEIRRASITFDTKFDALAKLAKSIAENKGHAVEKLLENFYEAGYTEGSLLDLVIAVGDKTITNYVYALTKVPVDFPVAPTI